MARSKSPAVKPPLGRPRTVEAERRVVTLRVDAALHDNLRRYAFEHHGTVTDIVAEALARWWDAHQGGVRLRKRA